MLKKALNFGITIPYLGEFKVKTLVRGVVIGLGGGLLVYGASKIPYVGEWVRTAFAKVSPYQLHRQV